MFEHSELLQHTLGSWRAWVELGEAFGVAIGLLPLALLDVEDGQGLQDARVVAVQPLGPEQCDFGIFKPTQLL